MIILNKIFEHKKKIISEIIINTVFKILIIVFLNLLTLFCEYQYLLNFYLLNFYLEKKADYAGNLPK